MTAALLALFLALADVEPMVVPVLTLVVGMAPYGGVRASLSRGPARRSGEFDALMDQFEPLARAAPEARALALDALPDRGPGAGRPGARSRTR